MPVCQNPDPQPSTAPKMKESPKLDTRMRRPSIESVRIEDCDGPIPDNVVDGTSHKSGSDTTTTSAGEALCSDRAELIERIKRGECPTWVPTAALKQEYLKRDKETAPNSPENASDSKKPKPLLPAAEFTSTTQHHDKSLTERTQPQLEIENIKPALHAGDFAHNLADSNSSLQESPLGSRYSPGTFESTRLGTSPSASWYSPSSAFHNLGNHSQLSSPDRSYISNRRPWRSRAPSLSSYSSSSYVLKAPTTPLVQQSNNTDLDFSPRSRSISPEKSNRRHTLPPQTLRNLQLSINSHVPNAPPAARQHALYRRENNFPHCHSARRSLNSNWSLQASTSPQTPAHPRSRRASFSSEVSPLQHAHMVGSYEESILRGWMSTAPSKPLDFTAQIGVLGKGDCKPKCPAHVTIPFPAVFYSWSSGDGTATADDDLPPYVGHIDLQHSSATAQANTARKHIPDTETDSGVESQAFNDDKKHRATPPEPAIRPRKISRSQRSSLVPLGSYRIPEQGQLQIIIKNPNKTAVKLFLVPYDLSGMEPGTKTFVRQGSYLADPATHAPPSRLSMEPTLTSKKPTLRYLIHLNICSPVSGRFYLYQQIRVVFANRIPYSKENLRIEVQTPQPKFSTYRPNKDCSSGPSLSAGGKVRSQKDYGRRRSNSGFDGLASHATKGFAGGSTFHSNSGAPAPPIPAIPFNLTFPRERPAQEENCRNDDDAMELDSSRPTTASELRFPLDSKANRFASVQLSSSYRSDSSQGSDSYNKLSKGDLGYGGVFGRPGTPEPGEGLLARRLKGLDAQRNGRQVEDEM